MAKKKQLRIRSARQKTVEKLLRTTNPNQIVNLLNRYCDPDIQFIVVPKIK